MQITANQDFKHETFQFEAGKTYDVPEAIGYYFVGNGWATAPGVESLPTLTAEHVLEIQDGALGVDSE